MTTKIIKGYTLKDACASCGRKIPMDIGNYVSRGNFCMVCNGKASKSAIGRHKKLAEKADKIVDQFNLL